MQGGPVPAALSDSPADGRDPPATLKPAGKVLNVAVAWIHHLSAAPPSTPAARSGACRPTQGISGPGQRVAPLQPIRASQLGDGDPRSPQHQQPLFQRSLRNRC